MTELLTHVMISQSNTKDSNLRKTLVGVIGLNNLYAAYFLGQTELAGA